MNKKNQAKYEMLKKLKQMMGKQDGEEVMSKPVKQVTVAAPDKAGLKEGMDHAKAILDKLPMDDEQSEEESPEHEAEESQKEEDAEQSMDFSKMSRSELEAMLKRHMKS